LQEKLFTPLTPEEKRREKERIKWQRRKQRIAEGRRKPREYSEEDYEEAYQRFKASLGVPESAQQLINQFIAWSGTSNIPEDKLAQMWQRDKEKEEKKEEEKPPPTILPEKPKPKPKPKKKFVGTRKGYRYYYRTQHYRTKEGRYRTKRVYIKQRISKRKRRKRKR
jgi:hypothetical protein